MSRKSRDGGIGGRGKAGGVELFHVEQPEQGGVEVTASEVVEDGKAGDRPRFTDREVVLAGGKTVIKLPDVPVCAGRSCDAYGQRWEYKTLYGRVETVEKAMNEAGADGWEAFAVRAWEGGQTVYMKRVRVAE